MNYASKPFFWSQSKGDFKNFSPHTETRLDFLTLLNTQEKEDGGKSKHIAALFIAQISNANLVRLVGLGAQRRRQV